MTENSQDSSDLRVLLLAPTAKDGSATQKILGAVDIDCCVCRSIDELCRESDRGAGALVLPEEALRGNSSFKLMNLLRQQPAWSDLPVIVMMVAGRGPDRKLRELLEVDGITLAKRPLEVATFVAAVQSALRDRKRQYQVRQHLTEQQHQADFLREADRRKDEFLAMLAHELRNPLAPIRNGLQIMQLAAGDTAVIENTRDMMDRQVRHLARLVDDLLDVSRITRGKATLRKESTDLVEILSRAVETVRPQLDARGHRLVIVQPGHPVLIEADPIRITQVVGNLLNNAVKYSEAGSPIQLLLKAGDENAVITVQDRGVGISADMLPSIFDLFTQIDRTLDRSEGGLGIGLTLVKSLVEMHGGRVEAFSDGVGKGSEFVVTLPLAQRRRDSEAVPAQKEAAKQKRPFSILVVDDNVDAAETLSTLLKLQGHDVCTVNNGLKVIESVATLRPHVAVLDLGLPGISGFELARELRRKTYGRSMLLIALTGYGQDEDRRRAYEAGFDHHLTKPADPLALQKILAEWQNHNAS